MTFAGGRKKPIAMHLRALRSGRRMRFGRMLFALLLLTSLPLAAAAASERALVIRAGDLMAQPFIDAAKVAPVAAGQPVVIVQRRGGWVNVQANGKTGWLRALNLRLEPVAGAGAGRPAPNALSRSASWLRTGSSGRTVTTGVKGLDEEKIRNAVVDPVQLAQLASLAVTESAARATAARKKLAESRLDYLKRGKRK